MIHRKYNFLTILLLLSFLGQTTAASAMVCKMDFQKGTSMMSMDHSMSTMNMDSASEMDTTHLMSMDCCQSNGSCSMMGCVVIAVPISIEFNRLKIVPEISQPIKISITIQVPLSLYRPPISA